MAQAQVDEFLYTQNLEALCPQSSGKRLKMVKIPVLGKYKLQVNKKTLDAKLYVRWLMEDTLLYQGVPFEAYTAFCDMHHKISPLVAECMSKGVDETLRQKMLDLGWELEFKDPDYTESRKKLKAIQESRKLEPIPDEEPWLNTKKRKSESPHPSEPKLKKPPTVFENLVQRVHLLKRDIEADVFAPPMKKFKPAPKPRKKNLPMTAEQEAQISAVIDSVIEESRKYAEEQQETEAAVAALLAL